MPPLDALVPKQRPSSDALGSNVDQPCDPGLYQPGGHQVQVQRVLTHLGSGTIVKYSVPTGTGQITDLGLARAFRWLTLVRQPLRPNLGLAQLMSCADVRRLNVGAWLPQCWVNSAELRKPVRAILARPARIDLGSLIPSLNTSTYPS